LVQATDCGQAAELEQLEAALFLVARRISSLRVSDYAGDVGVDKAGLAVLGQVHACGPARMSDVAAALGLDLSTVSRQVRQLESASLIERGTDPHDARATRLQVSDRGHQLIKDVRRSRQDLLCRALSGWLADDRETLSRLLSRLADDLNRPWVARTETA
jgi:DNA-binding MarR family transcriptional regulator